MFRSMTAHHPLIEGLSTHLSQEGRAVLVSEVHGYLIVVELITNLRIAVIHLLAGDTLLECPFANGKNHIFRCSNSNGAGYHLSKRDFREYQERFPQIDHYLRADQVVAELGPGFAEFAQHAQEKGCQVTTIDNAPFHAIQVAAEFALERERIEYPDGSGNVYWLIGNRKVVESLQQQSVHFMERQLQGTHYNAMFPGILKEVSILIGKFDLVVELNGPTVSTIQESIVKNKDLTSIEEILSDPHLRAYIQLVMQMLKPSGRLLWSIGENQRITIDASRDEIEAVLLQLPRE